MAKARRTTRKTTGASAVPAWLRAAMGESAPRRTAKTKPKKAAASRKSAAPPARLRRTYASADGFEWSDRHTRFSLVARRRVELDGHAGIYWVATINHAALRSGPREVREPPRTEYAHGISTMVRGRLRSVWVREDRSPKIASLLDEIAFEKTFTPPPLDPYDPFKHRGKRLPRLHDGLHDISIPPAQLKMVETQIRRLIG